MRNWKEVPIPERMQVLDKDRRGYPIPANVLRKDDGTPIFTVNDERFTVMALDNTLCPICAQKLDRGGWFVGGPVSALAENGCYIDLPMHEDCAAYALQVCPYLAAPNYAKRLDDLQIKDGDFGGNQLITVDNSMIPNRPPIFVMVLVKGFDVTQPTPLQRYLHPHRPFLDMRFWQNGVELDPETQGKEIRILLARGVNDAMETKPQNPNVKVRSA